MTQPGKSAVRPPWACSLWTFDDHIYLELPSTVGHLAHTLRLPNTIEGLTKALSLLNARNDKSTIGTKGDPTQYQVDKLFYDEAKVRRLNPKPKYAPEMISAAKEVLRRLNII